MPRVIIDYDKCIEGCELCEEACTVRLLVIDIDLMESKVKINRPRRDRTDSETRCGNIVTYDTPGCSNCRTCEIVCPAGAISIDVEDE